ncbi:MAG: hypothetical protein H6772_02310 [Pseudomonadales bacterium]|nr:hypothetical protein [Pseudomonadales bacterium]
MNFNNLIKKNYPLIFLVIFFSLFYFNYIILPIADLGRHIINGQEILKGNFQVLNENYYSYTEPNFQFPNHHWLFGVIAYLVQQTSGFSGLTLLNASFYILAFIFSLVLAKKKSSLNFTLIAGILAMPLITSRSEVRPESISLFMFSAFHYLFYLISQNFENLNNKKIFRKVNYQELQLLIIFVVLFLGQIVWTNSHLFFIFGPLISGMYLLNEIFITVFTKKSKNIFTKEVQFYLLITCALLFTTLINPHGLEGSLSPFHIFDNYNYRVAENQSVWFMIKIKNNIFKYYYFVFLTILGLATFFYKDKEAKSLKILKDKDIIVSILSFFIFGLLFLFINRASSFFGIVFIPIVAKNLLHLFQNNKKQIIQLLNKNIFLMIFSPIFIGLSILLASKNVLLPKISNIGIGLAPQSNNSVNFFINEKLSGPIFNNYDLGGFLIYHLFPNQKIFIDNRPESYSTDFISNIYIKAQEDEKVWQEVSNDYGFETIYFFRLDMTDWAQGFLNRRINDPEWIPVYVDLYSLILVKNDDVNQQIIENFALPNEIFSYKEL